LGNGLKITALVAKYNEVKMILSKDVHGIDKPYVFTGELKKQTKDAIRIINVILSDKEVGDDMKKKVIDLMLWNISGNGEGAHGQYLIRFRSTQSIKNKDAQIRHDHVYQRKYLRELILQEGVLTNETFEKIIGCVVTIEEHEKLHKVDKNLVGWDRYIVANIEVKDMENNLIYKFPTAN
jgi:hypothetical protein